MANARCAPRKTHPKCRPPAQHGKILRLRDDGRFVRDNGDPGVAFIGADPEDGGATIWVANCNCKVYLDCPLAKALAFSADRYSSATVVRRSASRPKKRKR